MTKKPGVLSVEKGGYDISIGHRGSWESLGVHGEVCSARQQRACGQEQEPWELSVLSSAASPPENKTSPLLIQRQPTASLLTYCFCFKMEPHSVTRPECIGRWGFTMLARMLLTLDLVIRLPWLPTVLGLQCGTPFSEEASATGIPDSARVPFATYKASGPICNFANLVGFRPAGPHCENVLIPENHFHDSASVRKHKADTVDPRQFASCGGGAAERSARAGKGSCTTGPLSSSGMFWGSTSL
ncbi:hypothetical protein AAY473_016965 [Plecturocebus cupreus]